LYHQIKKEKFYNQMPKETMSKHVSS